MEARNQFPLDMEVIKNLYVSMRRIRETEELIAREYSKQIFRCPVHLSIGQEAIASGVSINLNLGDKVLSTHRSHEIGRAHV